MFGRWLKRSNRLDHPEAARRLQAIEALAEGEAADLQSRLQQIVADDEDPTVASAALARLTSADALHALLEHPEHGDAVALRAASLMAEGADLHCRSHPRVLAARIGKATHEDITTLLGELQEPAHCAALALRFRDAAREEILAHASLQTESGLQILAKEAKGRDKSCHRYARGRLEQIKAAQTACQSHLERIEEMDVAITRTLNGEPDPYTRNQKLGKLQQMRAVEIEALEAQRAALEAAGGDPAPYTLPADPLAGMDLTPPPPAEDPFPALVERLNGLDAAMRRGDDLDSISGARDEVTNSWLQAADKHPPSPDQHAVFERVSTQFQQIKSAWQRLAACDAQALQASAPTDLADSEASLDPGLLQTHRKWLKRWRKSIADVRWPQDYERPAALREAEATLNRISDQAEALNARREADAAALDLAVKQAETAVDAGQIQQALAALKQARRLQKAGLRSRDRELAALSARMDEYRDWQQFATNPKRAALLEDIKTLAEAPADPPVQAEKLKALRTAWRQLGRPSNAEEAEQHKAFDAYAEQAFEPCRAYFAEQADQRAANLAARVSLCDQLEDYLQTTDWDTADMRAADGILRAAREEWRKHHPCERKALKPVETRFEGLQQALHDKLKASWDRNIAAKEDIVARARALLEEALDAQIDGAKILQQAWREVGPTPRGADQRLWRDFRSICDQIFAGRDAAREARQAAHTEQQIAVESALAALEDLLQTTVEPATWRAHLAALDERSAAVRLSGVQRRRREAAEAAFQAQQAAQRQTAAVAELDEWARWDTAVSQAEQNGTPMDAPHKRFTARLNGTSAPLDWTELVIEAELGADLPSPAEDQERRLKLQVEMMNRGTRPQDIDHKEMLYRWVEAGPKDALADSLRERFFTALKTRLR